MIAVGRYDPVEPGEAEVAFLVEDAHQGRGIGQLLLEHLAQAGRERGIERFVAEVLPDNQAMIHTFRDAGYRLASGYEDGVMMLEFPIDPTETAIGVMESREHRAEAASIEKFLNPASVAVIGASRRQDTIGHALVRNLVTGDYTGRVYVVNSQASRSPGCRPTPPSADIPDAVDVAVVAVPAESVQDVVLDCAAKGVHGLVVISSGFAETGEDGPAAAAPAGRAGPVLRPAADRAELPRRDQHRPPRVAERVAGLADAAAGPGRVLLPVRRARRGDPGEGRTTAGSACRRSSAPGNRADVSGNDLLQYWLEDDATEVVLLYLESIGNPRKFSRVARRVSRRKPVIAVRSGRSTQGVPMGHAVRRIAAPQAAVDAMFRQAGVIQVDTLDEMFDVAQLLAHQPLPAGRRVAVVGNSDALGLLATDAAAAVGLVVNRSESLGADATAEDFEDALDAAIDNDDVDAVVAVYIPPLNVSGEDVANVLAAVGEQSDKPLVSSFLGRRGACPSCCGCPTSPGTPPGAARCRPTTGSRPRSAPWPTSWSTPCGYGTPDARTHGGPGGQRPHPGRQAPGQRDPDARTPTATTSTRRERAALLAAYDIESWEAAPGRDPRGGAGRGGGAGLERGAQGHPRAAAQPARPGPRLAQHRHRRGDGRRLGDPHRDDHRPAARRLRGAEATRRPGSRWRSPRWRTRCSARWCRSASPGR